MPGSKGNKNALKHGLYAARISADEKKTLEGSDILDMQAEINYLRTVLSRMAKIVEKNGLSEKDEKALTDQTIKTVNSINAALVTLLNLITQQALLSGEMHDFEKQIEEGKFLARTRLDVYQYLTPAQPKRNK